MCILVQSENTIDYMAILDIAFKTATIFIAGFNVFFAVKIFHLKNKKEDQEKERDRKIQLLKTLILDHNLRNYYIIFEKIEAQLILLQKANLSDLEKQDIDGKIGGFFIELRGKFYDSLLAIDDNLYESIKSKVDELQTSLTETIFDAGINLTHTPKFDELINQKVTTTKTEIIKKLFNYRG